jgi:hypothetical protein
MGSRSFNRFGAELLNVCVGLGGWLAVSVLRLGGVISTGQWQLWMLLSLSFIVLPFCLIGVRLLSPTLDDSMTPKPRPPSPAPAPPES